MKGFVIFLIFFLCSCTRTVYVPVESREVSVSANSLEKMVRAMAMVSMQSREVQTVVLKESAVYTLNEQGDPLRALFVFEQIAGKPFAIESSLDNFLFLYSVLLACNPHQPMGWDEFIDALDEDKQIFERMNEILKKGNEIDSLLSEEGETEGQKKN